MEEQAAAVRDIQHLGGQDVVQPESTHSWPMTYLVLSVSAVAITTAWVALLGYGFWRLVDWMTE